MHGVLTLAGEGTRMLPWSRGLRKEFLPLYDRGDNGKPVLKPVAHLALETLLSAGADQVTLVVGSHQKEFVQNYFSVDKSFLRRHAHHADRLIETRRFYNRIGKLRIHLAQQPRPRGFGDAVLRAAPFVRKDPFLLHAGDAVLMETRRGELPRRMMQMRDRDDLDAVLLVRRVADSRQYGVVEGKLTRSPNGLRRIRVTRMEEKPNRPRSPWAATAVYAFSSRVFHALDAIRHRSGRRELELTDAIEYLIRDGGRVEGLVLAPIQGEWRSVGSPEGFDRALRRTHRWALRRTTP